MVWIWAESMPSYGHVAIFSPAHTSPGAPDQPTQNSNVKAGRSRAPTQKCQAHCDRKTVCRAEQVGPCCGRSRQAASLWIENRLEELTMALCTHFMLQFEQRLARHQINNRVESELARSVRVAVGVARVEMGESRIGPGQAELREPLKGALKAGDVDAEMQPLTTTRARLSPLLRIVQIGAAVFVEDEVHRGPNEHDGSACHDGVLVLFI
mmetsp:Transcript_37012/g.86451  ORF Transcript_37012/g.86451 Transcript_37012/m.86451 type:complete len:210 (+) Transcript_37012:242-871(+)